jgi:hypothetical protein
MDETKLTELLDRQAVSDVVIRYATGVDMRDWSAFRSCFCDEVEIDFSSWSGAPARTLPADDWVTGVRAGLSGFDATQHISANRSIEIEGDRASCVSYVQANHVLQSDGEGGSFRIGGYYTNHLVRTDAGWKIRSCRLTVTWTQGDRGVFERASRRSAERRSS